MSEYYWSGNIGFSASVIKENILDKGPIENALRAVGLYPYSGVRIIPQQDGIDVEFDDVCFGRGAVGVLSEAIKSINDPTANGEINVYGDEDFFIDISGTDLSTHDMTEKDLYYASDEELVKILTARGWTCLKDDDLIQSLTVKEKAGQKDKNQISITTSYGDLRCELEEHDDGEVRGYISFVPDQQPRTIVDMAEVRVIPHTEQTDTEGAKASNPLGTVVYRLYADTTFSDSSLDATDEATRDLAAVLT